MKQDNGSNRVQSPTQQGTALPAAPCSPLRHLDLFSGIGGFALAARMAGGIETVGFCEIDPWAQKVLAKNFPGVPIHDDVKTLKGNEYGTVELITGGYRPSIWNPIMVKNTNAGIRTRMGMET